MDLLAMHAEQCVAALPALKLFAKRLGDAALAWRNANDARSAPGAELHAPAVQPATEHDEHIEIIRGDNGTGTPRGRLRVVERLDHYPGRCRTSDDQERTRKAPRRWIAATLIAGSGRDGEAPPR
jgi:hypothetical protein